ncbi:MAG: exodeoxyribonuclease V subunit gamma, partial [Holophaga sp.]|nr:exodeoxyribonuclease V subunit gamma [Holophaga sp.]
ENIRLLNEVSDCDFTPAFEMPLQPTVLGQLQRDILHFQDPSQGQAQPDGSVRCLACPSPRREAEVVATEIWRLMEAHNSSETPLHFSDIAVVIPSGDQEAYRAHLQAAFHETHRIPMVQSDRALPIMRQTLEAVELLLALPTSGLTRSALLGVLQHPGLQRRFPDLDGSTWGRWCEEFGIVRGADQAAWQGTYLERDVLNWDQGLKRLALGAFMADDSEFHLEAESYRVNGAKDALPATTFMVLVRGLCADAQSLLHRKEDPRTWMQTLWRYLEKWLEVDEGEEAEAVLKALDRIRTFLERLFDRAPERLTMPPVDFVAARHLALEALERLKDEQPANLSKGVVIATTATMRAIPFRAMFLMGFGEGRFPTRATRSALDLRAKGRRPGDVSQTEKEKYLFLEMLLSARDHLVLSYVALDELSGEAMEPSGLYKEFRALVGDYLAPQWAPAGQGDPFLETHPLRRFDPAYFPEWFAGDAVSPRLQAYSAIAEAEARALWLGAEARSHRIVLPQSLGEVALEHRALFRSALATPEVPGLSSEKEILRISLQDLKTFLECPLSGAAAVRLGLRNRDLEDRASVEDELFESEFLDAWSLQREVVLASLRGSEGLEAVYDRCVRRLQDEGGAPFGVFSEVEKGKHLKPIQAWSEYLRGSANGAMPITWRLGTSRSKANLIDHSLPALAFTITIDGQPRKVELSGDLRVQLGGSLFLETGPPPSASAMTKIRRKALGAFLDHLVLACVDPTHEDHRARFVFEAPKKAKGSSEPTQEHCFWFPALTQEEAQAQLAAWIEDLLTGNHAVLFPIEAVLDGWGKQELTADSILAFVEDAVEQSGRSSISTLKGPVPDPTRYAPPPEPRVLAEARLGAFLSMVFPFLTGEAN